MAAEDDRKFKYLRLLVLCAGLFFVIASVFISRNPVQIFSGYYLEDMGTMVRSDLPPENRISLLYQEHKVTVVPDEKNSSTLGNRTGPLTQQEWKKVMKKRFLQRKDVLTDRCGNYNGSIPGYVKTIRETAFLFSRKYNFLVCITAKGGASTWKNHFLRINGFEEAIHNVHRSQYTRRIVATKMLSDSKFRSKTHQEEDVIRVMSVRHPFSRLVSAYNSKFGNGFYTKGRNSGHFGPSILSRLVGNITPSTSKLAFPFSLFLRSVVAQNNYDGKTKMNIHWRPYSSSCRPCHVPYDYIVKQETFDEDLRYIVLDVGIEEIEVGLRRNRAKRDVSYESYFRNISDKIISRLFSIYKTDMYLFDYETPQFVKDALARTGKKLD